MGCKMSDNLSFLYEAFNLYYERGMKAKDQNNYEVACKNILLAAETLIKLAQESKGELKKVRYEHATRLIDLAHKYKKDSQEVKSNPTTRKSNPSKSKEDDSTETNWKAATIPDISFDDVVGLHEVKESVRMRIILPIQYPDIYKTFRKKLGGGILLYGPPGTGKSMIAQAIAHEVGAHFYSVKSSDIVSKWFGEAEKNVKNLFEEARQHERSIIFFDEFEALAARRGGDSSVMNRLVPELLAQIQGFNQNETMLLLLAATNRPWDIDSAMLRPGRFNELLYIPLPDYDARRAMIEKNLKSIPIDPEVKIDYIAEITEGFNGADISEFCDRLKNDPIKRSIQSNNIENITMNDVENTKMHVRSSVQERDLVEFKKFEENRVD